MPISRFPRPGHPISPSLLAPLLNRKAPKIDMQLNELDARCWDKFGESTCRKLAKMVLEHLSRQTDEIVNQFGSRKIAPIGSNLQRVNLDLEVRTYNCLGSINIDDQPDGLSNLTIREVMSIRAFGVKSLVDLLTSIEAATGTLSTETYCDIPPTTNAQPNGFLPPGICDVIRRSGFIPNSVADLHIPRPPRGVKLSDLGLRVRTFNALTKAGYRKNTSVLGDLTLRQAIQIPSFGTESLCDLIEAIERIERACYPLFARSDVRRDEARALLEMINGEKSIPNCVLESTVPPLPPGSSIEDLGLHRRTFNVLDRVGFVTSPARISQTTIRELRELRGFGDYCIGDLLENVCRIRESTNYSEPAVRSRFSDVERLLETICSTPDSANIGRTDPRLGRLLHRLDSGAASIADLSNRGRQPAVLDRMAGIQSLADKIEECRNLTLEAELIDLVVGKGASERNRLIVEDYYGFSGGPLVTLEVVGNKYKVTRERIRQICAPSKIAKLAAPPFAPVLDSSLELVRDNIPCLETDLEEDLRKQELIQDQTTIHGLKRVAHFLRREADFESIEVGNLTFVFSQSQLKQLKKIEQTARKLVSKFGAAVIDDVLERCDIAISSEKAEQLITAAVGSMDGFRWLDKATGWFWFDSSYSRLRPRIRKVLSICDRIDVGDLRAAIRRDYHLHGRVPPKRILLEICLQMPEVSVEEREVVAVANEDPMELIRGDEAILVELLQDYGPLCRMEELQKLALTAGVSRPSFWRCLQFCPTIARFGPCVYGLTGATIQPGAIESLAGVRRSFRVIQDHGWTDDGNIWIAYRISQGAIESGVIGVPAAKRDYIQGQFSLKTDRGMDIGELSVKESSAWGLGPYLRRSGVEQGDCLLLEFQLSDRTTTVAVGDEGLIEQYQEAA